MIVDSWLETRRLLDGAPGARDALLAAMDAQVGQHRAKLETMTPDAVKMAKVQGEIKALKQLAADIRGNNAIRTGEPGW